MKKHYYVLEVVAVEVEVEGSYEAGAAGTVDRFGAKTMAVEAEIEGGMLRCTQQEAGSTKILFNLFAKLQL